MERKNAKLLLKFFFDKIINKKKNIKKNLVDEKNSLFLPRLYTKKNGWINWQWRGRDIIKFINSFDEPYIGSSTRYLQDNQNKKIVFLKDVSWENKKTKFHPFQSGLIVKKNKSEIIVATTDGSIKIKKVLNQKKETLRRLLK